MQVCVIGGGLAGTLLAWRLAQSSAEVFLAPGPDQPADATAVSGGAVRAYEVEPEQFSLALDSMAELVADARLAEWAGYHDCGSAYLPTETAGLTAAVRRINAVLPGSAAVVGAAELRRGGWADIDDGTMAVTERVAGYVSPARLRAAVLADLRQRRIPFLDNGFVSGLGDGRFELNGHRHEFDLVVLATGAWTPGLLAAAGFDHGGLTTKSIQVAIHQAEGMLTTAFVDDLTALFGRPAPGGVLLGLPTNGWGLGPTEARASADLIQASAELAQRRFPRLRLHSALPAITAVDCYAPDNLLRLRPVAGTEGRLLTYTGGSGGSVKTTLAASARASRQLLSDPSSIITASLDAATTPETLERSALTS